MQTTIPFSIPLQVEQLKECLFELFDSNTSEVNVNRIFLLRLMKKTFLFRRHSFLFFSFLNKLVPEKKCQPLALLFLQIWQKLVIFSSYF